MSAKKKKNWFSYGCYRIIRGLIWLFYPKTKVVGTENLPEDACIIVGNHTQMNGPICGELYFPGERAIWCTHEMMHIKEVPAYAFQDFWSGKPKWTHWFYRLLSYIIAPFSVCIFNNARTIAVYRDNRLLSTFKQTIAALQENKNVIIFPENYDPYNHIINHFQDKYIDIAKLYYKRTGKCLAFVPLYIAPALKTMYIGKPIQFRPDAPIEEERMRISAYLMDAITEIAEELPLHRVVPYANIPRKDYPMNKTEGVLSQCEDRL